jgi:allophanate hydrolase subunit 2
LLAVPLMVAVPPVLGSRSTHVISAMGGMAGRPLRAGDRIDLGVADAARPTVAPPADRLVELPSPPARLRVLPGPQADAFTSDALDTLQSAPYTVGQQSDRMGFRLEGPRLTHARGADIISDATPLGVLQVPASGQPILLMADRQTTGGYPKIATLIWGAYVSPLGPLKDPGTTVSIA